MNQFSEEILDKIDLLINDKLNSIEKVQFESEIASNPELSKEVSFQKDVIESIRANKRAILKSRLQQIEVSSKSKWLSKSLFSGLAASTVIAILSFTYFQYVKNDNNPNLVATDIIYSSEFETKTTQEQKILNENTSQTENSVKSIVESTILESQENSANYENIDAPKLNINTNGESEITTNSLATLDDLESVEIMKSSASNVEIEFKNPNSKNLAYKFYDQKLYLFGKFNTKNPYEVIEINTKFGKEFYLKFDKYYYTIKSGEVDKTPLLRIENNKLVNKLNELN